MTKNGLLATTERRFNLIISTLRAADMDATDLAREAARAGLDIPVVAMAYDNDERKDFEASHDLSDLDGLFSHDLTPTLSTPAAASAVEAAAARHRRRLKCQLKIDTGMHRLGFRHDNLARTIPSVLGSPHLTIDAVYTHFATADAADGAFLTVQRERFESALLGLQALGLPTPARHAANSAAMLRDERTWYDFVRPGLLLYGIAPPGLDGTVPLRPVMTLRSRIVAVKGIRAGDGVGYGLRFVDVIKRSEIPKHVLKVLGDSHSKRIDTMVKDLIYRSKEKDIEELRMSDDISSAIYALRDLLYERVYESKKLIKEFRKATKVLQDLYVYYLEHVDEIFADIPKGKKLDKHRVVCDFIAGMTDSFALMTYERLFLPQQWTVL